MKSGNYFRMIEALESIDRQLVLLINGAHNDVLDEVMWFFSGPYILIPMTLLILWSFSKSYGVKQTGLLLFGIIITIAIADLCSVYFFKEVFMRFRPSYNTELMGELHFHSYSAGEFYKGGLYGFVSSHAANYFALNLLCWTLIKHEWLRIVILIATVLILYSRVYLGVHYVSDVLCGAILGYLIAKLVLHLLILKQIKQV